MQGEEIINKYGKPMTTAKHLANAMTVTCINNRVGIIVLTMMQRAVSIFLTIKGATEGHTVIVGTA